MTVMLNGMQLTDIKFYNTSFSLIDRNRDYMYTCSLNKRKF